ncbi:EAL domain-containing protein [Aliikangiella maris]|uniref:EAL domain-containing protein n=2 Tax=Aliikangiella maris TaxID=3162458 RepID=A0ABV2BTW2_9GAMM
MTNDNLKQQKDSQLKAIYSLFILAVMGFAILLLLQAISLSRTQINYQNELMNSVSQSILKELTQTMNTQRLKIALFLSANQKAFERQASNPKNVDEKGYIDLLHKMRNELPSSRLYTIISPSGINLLEHITGNFLPDCLEEVSETTQLGQQQRLFLHRSKSSAHYDLIQPRHPGNPQKGYIFVAFNIDFIANLLQKYQLPFQQLFLLRNDKTGFIEVSSETTTELVGTNILDQQTLADFEHSLSIPNTRWSFAIRLDPQTKSQLLNKALWQSLITWTIITLLLFFVLLSIKRNLESKYISQLELNESRKKAEILINSVVEAVFSVDRNFKITFANSSAKALLNMTTPELLGKPFPSVCELYNLQETQIQSFNRLIENFQDNQIPEYSNLTLKLPDLTHIPVAVKFALIHDNEAQVKGFAITIEDLSTAVELSKRLVYQESRDSLTGLFNRRHLEKTLSKILEHSKQGLTNSRPAIILIDLDKFQLLNTSFGFEAGDEFLKRFAILLRKSIPGNDLLSRLSSDEFAVIIKNAGDQELVSICENIKSAVRKFEFDWRGENLNVSICLGVVKIDANFSDINDVLSAADHACRLAKTKGTNITQFYETDDPEIQLRTQEVTKLTDLKKALNQNNLLLYRQAIVGIDTNNKSQQKYEILVRIKDQNDNIILPSNFIPVAEKYGFMAKIDFWVLAHTFEYLAAQGERDSALYNINLSSKTLSEKRLIAFVESLFSQFSIAPSRINFEITETSAISYLENALDFMYAMKSKGCTFSLDDFGTGLASFDYLKKLPIDFVKIDGVFVKDLASNRNDRVFVEAIHNISAQLKIKTVAEYVETEEIFNIIKDIGIDYAQGYHLQEPEYWYSISNNNG